MNIKDLGYERAIVVPQDSHCGNDTLLITQGGVDWLNNLMNDTSMMYSGDMDKSFFGWLPGTLDEYDDHTPDQIENDIESVDEVMATRNEHMVHIVIHPSVGRQACFDLGWHEFVKPVPAPKPGNLETGEPFHIGNSSEVEYHGCGQFVELMDNQGCLVALVQVDEGDEEQEQILQFLVDAPKMRRSLLDDLKATTEQLKEQHRLAKAKAKAGAPEGSDWQGKPNG
jgi:hypothetical protein